MVGLRLPAVVAATAWLVSTAPGSGFPAHAAQSAPQGRQPAASIGPARSFAGGIFEAADTPRSKNDYPTATRADYVIGCMATNGNTREALLKCSCAIDTIAGRMPFSHYEEAETALSMQAGGGLGGRVSLFRDPPEIKAVIKELRQAQAEANLECR